MTKRLILTVLLILTALFPSNAQLQDPVHFSATTKRVSPTSIVITFKGNIDAGWHVYSTNIGAGGPTPATFHFDKQQNVETDGPLQALGAAKTVMDPVFNMKVTYFEGHATFVQKLKITAKDFSAKGYLEYGSCNDQNCMPPTQVEFSVKGSDGPTIAIKKDSQVIPQTATTTIDTTKTATLAATKPNKNLQAQWWQPSIKQLQTFDNTQGSHKGLLSIFILGFLGGLLALLTPCVWPIIPMTVSFFIHRADNRRRAIRESFLYGISIVVIYMALGLFITLLFGVNKLNDLSTNAFFNIFFFLLLLIFAASFLGGFEITLPASWNNKVNNKAETTTGLLSIFLMAFTLVLVSFSCTSPIIGLLLVEVSTMGNIISPTIGMLGFAIALALPFTLFALFPTWLKKAPKSGGWMNVVKVTLGFIELAFSLKFLSVADLAYNWHILDRETFLSLWIVIFALLGIYLLGKLKFPGDENNTHTSIPRFFLGLLSLAFALYMVPGLWGAPLKAISAFSPPLYTQDFNLYQHQVEAAFTDYESGMAYAKTTGKPVLLDFTGKGCVNCRKMENAVWGDPTISKYLKQDFVLISLYCDDKTPLPEYLEIKENNRQRTLRTVGDKWSYLQRHKFGANAQPFYVPVDNNGNPLNHSYAYDENISHFQNFLQTALENFHK
jgi:thiol:disulfide interchange protein DsbD